MDFVKINVYKKILSLFVAKGKYRPDWMLAPFNAGDDSTKSMATNAYGLVVVPKDLSHQWHGDKVQGIYPNAHTIDYNIDVEDIRNFVQKVPKEEIEVSYPKYSVCDACDGSKKVKFSYVWQDKTYKERLECPVCAGEGRRIVGFEVESHLQDQFSQAYAAKILEKFYSANVLDNLVKVADLLNERTVKLVYNHPMNRPNPMAGFMIGEVEVILMPIMDNDEFVNVTVMKLVGNGVFRNIIAESMEGSNE